ncbi:SUMF1/EgtB/PvdO family nonheme iron enzyme [Limnospira platensis]|uniref:SUMF1/EgtB/PvdO family nonheme iron enzyme n=1 Tax=Limnospira platensis TaxID=118562 RepID=UPI003D6DC8CE
MYWPNGHSLQNGKFTIETVLGQGGFGITYKALHRGFNAAVVIKTPNAFLRHDPDYAKYVQRFIREAQILAQLERDPNPHIVRVKDLFEESDSHCLVMEFIEGQNLYTLVQEQGPLSEATALALICPVAQALAQVHRAGIVHRDATPVNIMLRGNRQPVLIDFGIAGNVVPSVTSSKIFGNQAFAPYEQLIKGDRSPTVDIYTLAASLYYAVTGQLPRDCFSRKVDREELVPPKNLASVSDAINDAIMAGMALNKTRRPQSMQEWLKLLEPPKRTPLYRPKTTSFSFDIVTVNSNGQQINRRRGQAECIIEDLGNGVTLEMVMIPGGTFIMGAPSGEVQSSDDERPQHRVTIKPFLMGKYPVTQAQWRQVASFPKLQRDLSPDPSRFKGLNLPVEKVSWYDVVEWCARLSKRIGKPYRLPSEAEWEYAARAGTTSPFHVGDTLSTDLANYDGSYTYGSGPKGAYRQKTTPVGQFQQANAFGLYDIHGNVWEWCADPWHDSYKGAPSDGGVWDAGNDNRYQNYIEYLVNFLSNTNKRVLRGGSWYNLPVHCRCAFRSWVDPVNLDNIGAFRVACAPPTLSP